MNVTELSSATIHQFPAPDRRQHTTETFTFNRDVRADPDLPASVKVVSASILETFVDHRTGVAIVGADDIAKACGCSPATVKAAVNILAATYWHVERGSAGSGHANHYRKRQPADYSKVSPLTFSAKSKRANPRKEKGQSTSIKGQPADMNLYTSTSKQRPKAADVDSQSPVTEETTPARLNGAAAADLETLAQEIAAIPGIQNPHIRPKVEHLNRDDQTTVIARWIEITHERAGVAA